MSVITLCSASGSPGVTTTAIGLATVWPRPVLIVEADPSGSNGLLAGYLQGASEYETGLLELASSPLPVPDALSDVVRSLDPATPATAGSPVSYLVGTQAHGQAAGMRDLWTPLVEALADLERGGQDVIVDAGRLGLLGSPEPLLSWADLTLLVTRSTLPALAGARTWADDLRARDSSWRQPGLLVIGEGQPYRRQEITKVLGLPVIATIADDGEAAAVYHRGARPPRRFATGPLSRSLHAAAAAISGAIARRREELTHDVTTGGTS